jgi:c-di-AMP phosphodiesterase-like protein
MHEKAKFVFTLTLVLYLITLFTVSYVGVYLTYIALPVIVISGLIMYITEPKNDMIEQEDSKENRIEEIEKRLKELDEYKQKKLRK